VNLPERVTCLIAGGGPAGVMLGYLLGRAGVDVWVLEKHADFLRDFRGDTIHPSTLEVMHELGLVDGFLARPHTEYRQISGEINGQHFTLADFSHLPVKCPFVAFVPQWDFLNFMVEQGRAFPAFHVAMESEVVDLVADGDRIVGATVRQGAQLRQVRTELIVGADGRASVVRARAKLDVETLGVPMDVLWMRIEKKSEDGPQPLGRLNNGRFLVMVDRGDYWQCAFIIAKGSLEVVQAKGLPALREEIALAAPFLRDRLEALASWDDVKLLTVKVDRLKRWYRPGVLCIGDAAHAMSPIGGIGINLAIQDAVAAANILAPRFKAGGVSVNDLAAVERRRTWPTHVTQRVQLLIQDRAIAPLLAGRKSGGSPPAIFRVLRALPILRRLAARFIGLGVRPEHVEI
jgi:2-polyprenyl-6-methoxyphenol hydroxylase-like FAD-dependent oxidoreductase